MSLFASRLLTLGTFIGVTSITCKAVSAMPSIVEYVEEECGYENNSGVDAESGVNTLSWRCIDSGIKRSSWSSGPGISRLEIDLGDDFILTQVLDARMPLQVVADRIAEQRSSDHRSFALRLPSRRLYATAEELQISIRDVGLE